MFTGIIEETGTVKSVVNSGDFAQIHVACNEILDDVKLGDSIAVNGICLTVVDFSKDYFKADVSKETINSTSLLSLKSGDEVNLERALTLSSRLGGHIVSGHVDGVAKLGYVQKNQEFYNLRFSASNEIIRYVVKKGSVAISGVSLTVANVFDNSFEIAVIPHTFENTNLKRLKIGDFVNIETDILGKYIEKFLSTNNNVSISEDFLKENGFC